MSIEDKYQVTKFTEYHWRVEDRIDIYPTKNKYFIPKTGERGTYGDLESFLEKKFSGESNRVSLKDSCCKEIIDSLRGKEISVSLYKKFKYCPFCGQIINK